MEYTPKKLGARPLTESINLDSTPTPEEEASAFETPDEQMGRVEAERAEHSLQLRREFAESAKALAQTWVGFVIVLTFAQFLLKPLGYGLSETEFVAVVVSSLGSVLALWWRVGQSIYPKSDRF